MVAPEPPLDLESIVFSLDRETAAVDYKRAAGWSELGSRGQRELIRDLMAFGNSDTIGHIVIGVRESEDGSFERTGVTAEQAASYQPEDIGQLAREYADPEVRFALIMPELQGSLFVVLRVVPFATIPHICRRSYDNVLEQAAIYVRTDSAQSMKVPTAEYMRRLIERAIFNQGEILLERIRSLVGRGGTAAGPPATAERFREQRSRFLEGREP